MSVKIELEIPAETKTGIKYCSELVIVGYELVRYTHINTIDGSMRMLDRTPEQTVTDGAYTEEQRQQLSDLLQIGCDFYATFERNPSEDDLGS